MKRLFLIVVVLLSIIIITGCSGDEASQTGLEEGERISIVVQIFPQYDWVRQIIGEEKLHRFDLTFLLSSGVDTHSFNPSVSDMVRIKTSDVFMYVGGHSDGWVYDVLRSPDMNPDIVTMNLLDVLGDDILLQGFCDVEDCDLVHDDDEFLADEHVWLSLRFAMMICDAIADMLAEIDPAYAHVYRNNADAYIARLAALDAEFLAVAESAAGNTIVVADRFPFRYLFYDYGLIHYAAFRGCSAESEASFVTVISLATRLDQLGLDVVMVTETSDQSIARTVISSTNSRDQRILVLDSMKSVSAADARNGVTYLSIMENNLKVLREALG